MKKIISAILLSAALLMPTSTVASPSQQAVEKLEILKKEVSCILINDYTIRHLNILILQLDAVDDSKGERRKSTIPLIAMAMVMRSDADKLTSELVNEGLDRAFIDARLSEITNEILDRYSQGYIDSVNFDKAIGFVLMMMMDQQQCEKWFKDRFGGTMPPQPKDNSKGGVDG